MIGGVKRPQIFLIAGGLGVAVAVIGFAKTFFYPLLHGTFSAPPVVYVHGAFLFGWVTFFLSQSILVHRRKLSLHRAMGWLGGVIAIGVVATTLAVGTLASRRMAASGELAQAQGELLIIMIEMLVFATLFSAAILARKRPETHKRLMLLVLIASLGPAWFRFRHYFPEVDNPVFFYSLLIADSLIVFAAVADFLRNRHVHWVYLRVGSGVVVVHLIEVFLFQSSGFQALARALAGPFL